MAFVPMILFIFGLLIYGIITSREMRIYLIILLVFIILAMFGLAVFATILIGS